MPADYLGPLHVVPEVEEMEQQSAQYDESENEHVLGGPLHAVLAFGLGIANLSACPKVTHGEDDGVHEVEHHARRQDDGPHERIPVSPEEIHDGVVSVVGEDQRPVHNHVEGQEQYQKRSRNTHNQLLADR